MSTSGWIASPLVLCLCFFTARADDSLLSRLEAARKSYDQAVEKYKPRVADYFDKREAAARSKGDKKAVDQVKNEREAFAHTGELPPALLQQPFVLAMAPLRQKVNQVYIEVVKDHVKGKRDAAADSAENERRAFVASSFLQCGRRVDLTTLTPFDVRPEKDSVYHFTPFMKTKKGDIPHSLWASPPTAGFSQANYKLGGKWTALRVRVGIPDFLDTQKPPASEVTFEVLGDGESLWKSKPTKTLDEFQLAEVCLEKVKVLSLRVHCPGAADWCRGCWLEPVLAQ